MLAALKAKISPGRLLIDGQWVDGSKKFDTINPATGEVLTQIAEASPLGRVPRAQLLEPSLERCLRLEAEQAPRLRRIGTELADVTRTCCGVQNLRVGPPCGTGDQPREFFDRDLTAAPEVQCLANHPIGLSSASNGTGEMRHVREVACLEAIAEDDEWLAGEGA